MALKWFSGKTKNSGNTAEPGVNGYEQTDDTELPEESPDGQEAKNITRQLTRPAEEDPDEDAGTTVELEIRPQEILPFEILEEIMILHSDVHM